VYFLAEHRSHTHIKTWFKGNQMEDLTAVVIDDDQDLTPILSELLITQRIKLAGIGFSDKDAARLVNRAAVAPGVGIPK